MSEYSVEFTNEALENHEQSMATLLEAIDSISNASQDDFEKIKDTKWYKRLWELITFSKNNEKRLASGVSNLAKLQEVIMKAVLLLSQTEKGTAEDLLAHEEALNRLASGQRSMSKIQNKLIQEIEQIKNGIENEIKLEELSDIEKIIVSGALNYVGKDLPQTNESRNYYGIILKNTGMPQNFNMDSIENFSSKKTKLLYRILTEYALLSTGQPVIDSDILEYISISPKTKRAIEETAKEVYSRAGAEALAKYYDSDDKDYLIEEDSLEFDNNEKAIDEAPQATKDEDDFEDEFGYNYLKGLGEYHQRDKYKLPQNYKIPEGKEIVIEGKEIEMDSIIECAGTLLIRDCTIRYNCDEKIGQIHLSDDANLKILGSIIICVNKRGPFFISDMNPNKESETVMISGNYLLNCTNFIEGNYKEFVFSYNHCLGNLSEMIRVSTGCVVTNYFHVTSYERSMIHGVPLVQNCMFTYLSREKTDHLIFGNSKETDVIQCTFNGFTDCLAWVRSVSLCSFENCSNIIQANSGDNIDIKDCLFQNCQKAIRQFEGNGEISGCQFVNCSGEDSLISIWFNASPEIKNCEFINSRIEGVNSSLIELNNHDKNSRAYSNIHHCRFIGALIKSNVLQSYLISGRILNKVDFPLGFISECTFTECYTDEPNKKVIKQYDSFKSLIGGEKDCLVIKCYNTNIGLDKVMGSDAFNPVSDSEYTLLNTDSSGEYFIGSILPIFTEEDIANLQVVIEEGWARFEEGFLSKSFSEYC